MKILVLKPMMTCGSPILRNTHKMGIQYEKPLGMVRIPPMVERCFWDILGMFIGGS